ncbi:hypothetical protein fugu_007275 [Takifugu bimaculatus]|uniref:Uncharacterized protein n=1 Tax=Takifugu bimaculatus TaxID=433685 RepID=A0A4Z2B4X8_9TELE|nr:hypothetical protein fugu_007275 [Takifugu bimaculatus]
MFPIDSDGTGVKQEIRVHHFNTDLHANSGSPSTPPLPPSSPPPSSLIEILPGIQTLPIVGTELREGERERETTPEPAPFILCPVHCVCQAFIQSRGPGDQEIQ